MRGALFRGVGRSGNLRIWSGLGKKVAEGEAILRNVLPNGISLGLNVIEAV